MSLPDDEKAAYLRTLIDEPALTAQVQKQLDLRQESAAATPVSRAARTDDKE